MGSSKNITKFNYSRQTLTALRKEYQAHGSSHFVTRCRIWATPMDYTVGLAEHAFLEVTTFNISLNIESTLRLDWGDDGLHGFQYPTSEAMQADVRVWKNTTHFWKGLQADFRCGDKRTFLIDTLLDICELNAARQYHLVDNNCQHFAQSVLWMMDLVARKYWFWDEEASVNALISHELQRKVASKKSGNILLANKLVAVLCLDDITAEALSTLKRCYQRNWPVVIICTKVHKAGDECCNTQLNTSESANPPGIWKHPPILHLDSDADLSSIVSSAKDAMISKDTLLCVSVFDDAAEASRFQRCHLQNLQRNKDQGSAHGQLRIEWRNVSSAMISDSDFIGADIVVAEIRDEVTSKHQMVARICKDHDIHLVFTRTFTCGVSMFLSHSSFAEHEPFLLTIRQETCTQLMLHGIRDVPLFMDHWAVRSLKPLDDATFPGTHHLSSHIVNRKLIAHYLHVRDMLNG